MVIVYTRIGIGLSIDIVFWILICDHRRKLMRIYELEEAQYIDNIIAIANTNNIHIPQLVAQTPVSKTKWIKCLLY